MSELEAETVVRFKGAGVAGVTVRDNYGVLENEEVAVVFGGGDYFTGVEPESLEVLGPYKPVVNPKACGAGEGAVCCRYLVIGGDAPSPFLCARFGRLRDTLIMNTKMGAQRTPRDLFPNCYLHPELAGPGESEAYGLTAKPEVEAEHGDTQSP